MSDDADMHILELAKQRGYYSPRCKHTKYTLAQHIHKTFGWFAVYQCDDCGLLLDKPAPSEHIDPDNSRLPNMDVARAEFATDAVIDRMTGSRPKKTMQFFSKAILGR